MRRTRCQTWIFAVGTAVVVSLAGCSGTEAPVALSPSSPPPDPDVAFAQYEKASKPFECTTAYSEMGDAAYAKNFDVMKEKAGEHRDVVATWDAALGNIAFPNTAQPIVDRMRELNASELAGLNELANWNGEDAERRVIVRSELEVDDSTVRVEGNRLRAALGHPVPQA